jgi:type IV secretion system protein VirB6
MEFFQTFWNHLDVQLRTYISVNTANVATALTPVILLLGTIYITLWGYLHLLGKIDEPFTAGLKRILTLAVVFLMCLQLWLYNELIVDTFYTAPTQLAQAIVSAAPGSPPFDAVNVVDDIWANGSEVAENLWSRSGGWPSDWGFALAAAFVWLIVAVLCIYTMFLLALSKVALAILLALGPLFIVMLLFEATKSLFMGWMTQLANYALVTVLTTMVCVLFLQTVQTYAAQTSARGSAIFTTDVLDMLLMCGLAILFLMQVPQVAASLAGGGPPLTTQNGLSRAARGTLRGGAAGAALGWRAGGFIRGAMSSRLNSSEARKDWSAARTLGYRAKMALVGRNSIEPTRSTTEPKAGS